MLNPRWRKVLRDLWNSKLRTTLVVLSIAVGVFAIGMIQSSQTILARDLAKAYADINPASALFFVLGTFDDELVESIKRVPGVKDAEQRRQVIVRFKDGDGEWRNLQLFIIPDFDKVRINIVRPHSGAWPPGDRELLIERASLRVAKVQEGDVIEIEGAGGKIRELRVAGTAYDFSLPPPEFNGSAFAYVNNNTLAWLGGGFAFDGLNIITENNTNRAEIVRVANLVNDKIERGGLTVQNFFVPDPGKHPLDSLIQPLLLVMGAAGFLTLGLSGFLVVNTIAAVLTQQIRQIGVMKAVGAITPQVMQLYFGMVVIFGLLSLLCAVPLGAVGAQGFVNFVATIVNYDPGLVSIPPQVLVTQIGVGLLVPLIAALFPIVSGVRVTVREALSQYGLGKGRYGMSFVDRIVSRVRGLSRPILLSIRNTFRRKVRLTLTLITLILASMIFITILSLRDSLALTLDEGLNYFGFDVEVIFPRSYRDDLLIREALRVPGVQDAETWGSGSTRRVRPDGTESDTLAVIAPPAKTRMIQPKMVTGRWLQESDEAAIVLNTDFLANPSDANVKVGDEIVLKIGGKETKWQVVGIARGLLTGAIAYINQPYYARLTNNAGRSPFLLIKTEQGGEAAETAAANALEAHFKAMGMKTTGAFKVSQLRGALLLAFNFIIGAVMIMAVLLAVVGGLGLMSTMSINVLERTREIGVMRAIGASNGAVLQIILSEGIFIGLISWFVGLLLALPIGRVISQALGQAIFRTELSYTFSVPGAALWLALVIILASLASFLPAWNASRLTVREVLAYE
jgi:putative ABC transport system permease protein